MPLTYEVIECQIPPNSRYINRTYKVIKVVFHNTHENQEWLFSKVREVSSSVNPHYANNSAVKRNLERVFLDNIGGVLAEYAWFAYLKRIFGKGTVNFTEFNSQNQIDLMLSNGKTIEIRSSFPKKGVKFAVCNEYSNFKNICKYENLYKPNESIKDLFLCTLFETQKENLLYDSNIIFYLLVVLLGK